jgi:hypothetical protein
LNQVPVHVTLTANPNNAIQTRERSRAAHRGCSPTAAASSPSGHDGQQRRHLHDQAISKSAAASLVTTVNKWTQVDPTASPQTARSALVTLIANASGRRHPRRRVEFGRV